MTRPALGLVPIAAGEVMAAVAVPGASAVAVALAGLGAVAVLAAARRPSTSADVLAVLLVLAALALGHPPPAQGCLAGLLALVFLLAVEAMRTKDPHTTPGAWLAARRPLLSGALLAAAAVILGGLVGFGASGTPALAVAGVLAIAAAYLLATRGLRADNTDNTTRRAP